MLYYSFILYCLRKAPRRKLTWIWRSINKSIIIIILILLLLLLLLFVFVLLLIRIAIITSNIVTITSA